MSDIFQTRPLNQGASVPVLKEHVEEDPEQLCLSLLMEVITESSNLDKYF